MFLFIREQTRNSGAPIVAIGSFAFNFDCRITGPGDSVIKPIQIGSSIGLDRLATWNEVKSAISVSKEGVPALGGAYNHLRQMDSDFDGSDCNLHEDDLWLAIVREIPDSKNN
jgi:hypothetical protein